MPIKIARGLPAAEELTREGVFVIQEERAARQDIRPLKIALLNLMPEKQKTERMIARLLGNTPLQVDLTLLAPESYTPGHTSPEHMLAFYRAWPEVRNEKFDGLVITGAPVELLPFEEVKYWQELKAIFDWSQTNVFATFTLCWAAQAALFHFYGIEKRVLPEKLFGLYGYRTVRSDVGILRGFDDRYVMPVSRHTEVAAEDIAAVPGLQVMAHSAEVGPGLVVDEGKRMVLMFNHLEYEAETLGEEYRRDCAAGKNIALPVGYFQEDDTEQPALNVWRAHAHLLFANWLNQIYQDTPYDVNEIPAPMRG